MNTIPELPRRFTNALAFLLVPLIMGASFLVSARADVLTLDFVGGGSTGSLVTNSVDAYTGMAGDGWLTAWTGANNGGMTRSAQVLSASPLTAGKNYLEFTVNKTTDANPAGSGTASRQYDNVSLGAEQVVSFQFRLDSDPADLSRIRFLDSSASRLSESQGASWFIRADANGNWTVFNGQTSINTGLALLQNNIYDFSINISTNSYVVSITNLTTAENYVSPSLNFYSDSAIGGYLNFIVTPVLPTSGTTTSVVSLGAISAQAVPEPGQVALLGAAALAFAGCRFWKMRRKP